MDITGIILAIGVLLTTIFVISLVFAKLYKRATNENALIRTGMGGQHIVINGGTLVVPYAHEIIRVNLSTQKLEVTKVKNNSLSTKDRMRVDVSAAFFIRVQRTSEGIAAAAQSLGGRGNSHEALALLLEDKAVDALRSAAVTMTMKELQDNRRAFVQAVQHAVSEDLEKNGLELESVSLTSLEQTDKSYFNANNAFDAEGLTILTTETENRRRERNEIETKTEVTVQEQNLAAKKRTLEIAREGELAAMAQAREIANSKAEQAALIAQTEANRSREGEEARIEADRMIAEKRVQAQQSVRTQEIEAEQKNQVLSAEQRRAIEVAAQESQIAIAVKSRDKSVADAAASKARAEAVTAEQEVITAQEVAVAEREKQIVLIAATQVAEQAAIGITVQAKAEREAAVNSAEAVRIKAEAEKDAALAQAAGIQAITEAKNKLSDEQIQYAIGMERLRVLPSVIEQAVKPMEKIDSIRLFHMNGSPIGGNGASGPGAASTQLGSMPDQVANAALNFKMGKDLIGTIFADAGLGDGSMTGMLAAAAAGTKVESALPNLSSDAPEAVSADSQ